MTETSEQRRNFILSDEITTFKHFFIIKEMSFVQLK